MKIGRQCVFWAGGVRQTAPWQSPKALPSSRRSDAPRPDPDRDGSRSTCGGNIISIDNTIEEGRRLAVFEPNQRSQGDESDAAMTHVRYAGGAP